MRILRKSKGSKVAQEAVDEMDEFMKELAFETEQVHRFAGENSLTDDTTETSEISQEANRIAQEHMDRYGLSTGNGLPSAPAAAAPTLDDEFAQLEERLKKLSSPN